MPTIREERKQADEQWVLDRLKNGAVLSRVVISDARAAGISTSRLYKARVRLRNVMETARRFGDGEWVWRMKPKSSDEQ